MNSDSLPNYSVKELNQAIGNLINRGFAPRFLVGATISRAQLKNGHLWLTLTDGQASITSVVWSSTLQKISYKPIEEDGVQIIGKLNFWETRANLVVQVIDIRPSISTVLRKFELVQRILTEEGLIDEERRRDLPDFPKAIGILTSVPSSALADMLRTAKERWPLTRLFIFPIPVQGDVSKNIQLVLDIIAKSYVKLGIQAIVVARGGGSREDLIVFDDEDLCRRIADFPIPVVTGLGHEDDLTVADLVADHRSATPTASIVDLLPSREMAKINCLQIKQRLHDQFEWIIRKERQSLLASSNKFKDNSPVNLIKDYKNYLDQRKQIIEAFSPYKLLSRGFSVLSNDKGNIIRSVVDVKRNDVLNIQLLDGRIDLIVDKIYNKKKNND